MVNWHPDVENLQGKKTVLATFSIAKFLMLPVGFHWYNTVNKALISTSIDQLPSGPLHVGQQESLGLQFEQTCKQNQVNYMHNTLIEV